MQPWHLWGEGRWLELLETSFATEIHTIEARRYINFACTNVRRRECK
jgi:hypothetical protein